MVSTGATKPDIVVPVVRIVPVAVGAPAVVTIIVPRAAAHNILTPPPQQIITYEILFINTAFRSNSFLKTKLFACFT